MEMLQSSLKPVAAKRKFENDVLPSAKRQTANYSLQSLRMMEKIGYTGCGLEKKQQDRMEPIKASTQLGRRGFGAAPNCLDLAAENWSPEMETIELREHIEMISDGSDSTGITSKHQLDNWMSEGPTKLNIDNETTFCDANILRKVLAEKTICDEMDAGAMEKARQRSNPFETIGKEIFINRAATKMANIDAMFEYTFTQPTELKDNELLYFADMCAGPGGFSEYVLWRKKWQAKGFNFTLKAESDVNFIAGRPETLCSEGDGDAYHPLNIESFTEHVLAQTTVGVHLMMSDGGFLVQGQKNTQEVLSKRLYLCQCLLALSIVRTDGHFVTKLFDVFTPFSVGLIYLMYKCFGQIGIVKPNTSRPASSERYLVCKWKKPDTEHIRAYLFDLNLVLQLNGNSEIDITGVVPLNDILNDNEFFSYICNSNNSIGRNQVGALMKIAHYHRNQGLIEPRQEELRLASLALWQIPNCNRTIPVKQSTDELFKELLGNWYPQREFLGSVERCLTAKTKLRNIFYNKDDWMFVPVENVGNEKYNDNSRNENAGNSMRTFFMSQGDDDVHKYVDGKWEPVEEIKVKISHSTLFYGEIVNELSGEGQNQAAKYALHIIDGIVLGGTDIRNFKLSKRNQMCQKFAETHNKSGKLDGAKEGCFSVPIRCKILHPLPDLHRFFSSLKSYKLKDNKIELGQAIDKSRFYVPRGILILKSMKPNICRQFNAKTKDYFYTDLQVPKNFKLADLKDQSNIYGSFKSAFAHRKLWQFEENTDQSALNSLSKLDRRTFEEFINEGN